MSEQIQKLENKLERLIEQQKWDEIINVCSKIVQSAYVPDYKAIAYNGRGIAYCRKGDYGRALGDHSKAIEINQKYATAYFNRGNAYSAKGDNNRAIEDYSKAIELDPEYAPAYNGRGFAYCSKDDFDRAIADHSKAIELDPEYAPAYNDRGFAYYSKDDFDKAITDYSKAIELDSEYASAYNDRGFVYCSKNDFDRAIADHSKAIELDPEYALAYRDRGFAYYLKDDFDKAIADYSKAIELDPEHALAYRDRGFVYYLEDDSDKAIADYSKAIELDPEYAPAYSDRGNVYNVCGENESAFNDYLKCGKYDETIKSTDSLVYIADRIDNLNIDSVKRIDVFSLFLDLIGEVQTIRKQLFYGPKSSNAVAHYASLNTLKVLVEGEPFHLYNVAYMNDPEEGQVFFELMKNKIDVENKFYQSDQISNHLSPAYVGSFVRVGGLDQKDRLSLWRLYGKHNNEEATGACLIFKTRQFAKDSSFTIGAMSKPQEDRLPELYRVIYKSETDADDMRESLDGLSTKLEEIAQFIDSYTSVKDELTILVREVLDSIRFLFKADNFKDEEEVRIVQMSYYTDNSGQSERKIDEEYFPPRIYLEMPDNIRFSEVILGPKSGKLIEWQLWLKEKRREGKIDIDEDAIKKSKIPFA